jgi:diphthamide synthase subunit DPH2
MPHTRLVHRALRFSLLVVSLCSVGCRTFTVTERDLLQPDQRVEDAAAERQRQVERFTVRTEHGDIAVTRIGCADNQTRPRLMRSFATALRKQGKQVVLVEIDGRGHGQLLNVERIRTTIADFVLTGSMP